MAFCLEIIRKFPMNIFHLIASAAASICFFFIASSSRGEQVASTPTQNHMLVVITSTAQTQEVAQKDAERLKNDFVYTLLKSIGLQPTAITRSVESKTNPNNSYTYKLTMTGDVHAVPIKINNLAGNKKSVASLRDADRYLITGLSVSNISGTGHKGPYHDIEIVISSKANK